MSSRGEHLKEHFRERESKQREREREWLMGNDLRRQTTGDEVKE